MPERPKITVHGGERTGIWRSWWDVWEVWGEGNLTRSVLQIMPTDASLAFKRMLVSPPSSSLSFVSRLPCSKKVVAGMTGSLEPQTSSRICSAKLSCQLVHHTREDDAVWVCVVEMAERGRKRRGGRGKGKGFGVWVGGWVGGRRRGKGVVRERGGKIWRVWRAFCSSSVVCR